MSRLAEHAKDAALAALGVAVAVVARGGDVIHRDDRMAALTDRAGTAALDTWLREQAARVSDGSWMAAAPNGATLRVTAGEGPGDGSIVIVAQDAGAAACDSTIGSSPLTAGDEASLTRLVRHAPFALSVKDAEGRYRACNAEVMGGILGDPRRLIGRRARDVIQAEVAADIEDHDAEALRRDGPVPRLRHWPARPGVEPSRTLSIKFPVPRAPGEAPDIGTIDVDVTDLGANERVLNVTASRFEAFLHNAPMALSIKDETGRYVAVNGEFLRNVRRTADQVIGKTLYDILPLPTARAFDEADKRVIATGLVLHEEVTLPDEVGRRDILSIRFPIRDPDGAIIGVGACGIDITERSRLERRARQDEAIMAQAQRQANLCHWVWAPTSNGAFPRVGHLEYSASAEAIFGMDAVSLAAVDRSYVERFVHPEDRTRVREAYQNAHYLKTGRPLEYRIVRPDGDVRTIVELAEYLPAEDDLPPPVLGTIQDITVLKRSEHELRVSLSRLDQAQQMARLAWWRLTGPEGPYEWSANAAEVLGFVPTGADEEALARVHPEDRDRIRAHYGLKWPAFDGRTTLVSEPVEYREVLADGRLKWLRETETLVRGGPDGRSEIVGVVQDITDIKNAEARLRDSLALLNHVRDITHLAWFRRSQPDGPFEYSENAREVMGIPPPASDEEGLGYVHPEDRDRVREHWARNWVAFKRGEPLHAETLEYRLIGHNGDMRWMRETCSLVEGSDEGRLQVVGSIQNITAIKRTEHALRKTNERLLAAQRLARIADWEELDPGNSPAAWSPTAESIFGPSPPLTEQALLAMLHPDDRDRVKAAFDESFRQSMATRQEVHLSHEYRVCHPTKGWIWLRESIHHQRDAQGRLVASQGTVQDVTSTKEAEQAIHLRDAILGAVSRAAARFLAAKSWRDEIDTLLADIGQGTGAARISVYRIVCDAERAIASHVAEWSAPGIPSLAEHDILREHDMRAVGLGRWVDAHARGEAIVGRVRDMPEGEHAILALQGVVSTATVPILVEGRLWGNMGIDDFTEGHSASSAEVEALRTAVSLLAAAIERDTIGAELGRTRASLQALFEHAPFGISIKDLEGRYLMVNPMSRSVLGVAPEAMVGRTVDEVFPETAGVVRQHEAEVLATGRAVQKYFPSDNPDTALSQLAIKFPIRGADDAVVAIGTIALDMSEQRRLEQRLAEVERLRSVGQLTGGVAHDFNNMLTSILGNIELAEEQVGAASPALRFLETARRATERSAELTHRLLAFARRQTLAPRVVDVKARITGVIDLITRPLGPSIAVALRLDDATWPALVDAGQLENALVNLALNARDAMPNGGTLTIATGNVTFDAATAARESELLPGDYVEIAVTDDGVGMTGEVMARAFEPFFTTKDKSKGTGLGLSMVFGFVKQSNGHVRVESMVGQGTTVRLFLPRARDPVPYVADRDTRSPLGSGETVLVVEDEADVRASVAAMLERLGYRTLQVDDGPSALALVQRGERVDVVLTDVVMPGGMTGRTLADLLARSRPALPVIFMSGFAADAFDAWPDGLAGARFLAKPFKKEELARAVRDALKGIEP